MKLGWKLRIYRKRLGVGADELARELGYAAGTSISRRERGELPMSRVQYAEAITAVEKIVERRQAENTPADVLGNG